MNIIHAANELETKGKRVCLAIGFFDGVHLGHQQILRQTIADARQHDGVALVLTFDQHPATIVAPDKVPPLIYTLPQKLRAIESPGVENILLIRFDKKFSEQSGEQFIRGLAQELGKIRSICVGASFVFGHKRSGNVTLLKKLGTEMDFSVHGLSALSLDGQRVSSTRVREAIRAGDFDDASQMLGRPYAISGKVAIGDKLGRKLGFPTANLDVSGLALPPNGVYAALTKVGGTLYRVALNIGFRPTVAAGKQLRVEAHLLDFQGELYGQELEIEIGEKLRDEKKFASPEELREQIARDVAAVRQSS
ncbi:MAG TPA: bifunctional riboflavin kinase/FAD synthetase [Candidatus Acidoferrales bacterium]|jgi:riboflavin kinase/FMN adenylyltransferase|nr:bifunctional riboflavin kinase/FAD synthetase [Candidatus Acidoferrales bacterium]